MNHSFNIKLAITYGIEEAIILENLIFWIKKNKANNKHFFDGKYWTYNSCEAFCRLFPYLTKDKIYRVLRKLKKGGAIETGNYNLTSYDRTKWYTIANPAIWQIYKMEVVDIQNGSGKSAKSSYTDINTPINTDEGRTHFNPPTLKEVNTYLDAHSITSFDGQYFIDYYEARGWLLGKVKIKSWQACVRTWAGRDKKKITSLKPKKDTTTLRAELKEIEKNLKGDVSHYHKKYGEGWREQLGKSALNLIKVQELKIKKLREKL